MLNIIPARELQKSYKSIIERVKAQKQTVVLTTNNQPQVALVSLEDWEELKRAKAKKASLELLNLATESSHELKDLPEDLRTRANEILYTK